MANEIYDVLVLGGGFGGLVAAASAAERGKRVLLVEVGGDLGGTMALSSGLMHMYDAPSWEVFHKTFPTVNQALGHAMFDAFPDLVHWLRTLVRVPMAKTPLPSDPYKDASRVPSGYVLGLSESLWVAQPVLKPLSEMGYSLLGDAYLFALDRAVIRGVRRIVAKCIWAFAEAHGAQVVLNARVNAVTRRADGNFEVKANASSAAVREVGKTVILAMGGFQGNPSLLEQYIGSGGGGSICRAARTNVGDGLRIGQELGGALDGPMDRFYGYPMPITREPFDHENDSIALLACSAYYASSAVLVNRRGERFVDEPAAGKNSEVAHAVATKAGGECWAILDHSMRERFAKRGFGGGLLPPMDLLRNSRKRGAEVFEESTLEGLVQKVAADGVDAERLGRTLTDYNRAAAEKTAGALTPPRCSAAEPLRVPPFYGIKLVPGISMTYGGLRINGRAELLGSDNEVIPRVYAIPGLAGGLYTRQYGGALAACGTFGRIAGRAAG